MINFICGIVDRSDVANDLILFMNLCDLPSWFTDFVVVVVALLFYVHGKHLRSCRDGQLT